MFRLEFLQKAVCTHANPRIEHHAEDLVRAIDLAFRVRGENTLLDLIEPGLRRHYYCNPEAEAGQEGIAVLGEQPLSRLRYPKLPRENIAWKDQKLRGFRWRWDWGTDMAHVLFRDCIVADLQFTAHDGGSVDVCFKLQYNGDELNDNRLYGELCGLPGMGEIMIQLLAPGEPIPVKKGYRAGRFDTPQPRPINPAQGNLDNLGHLGDPGAFKTDADDDTEHDVVHPEGSPEAALIAAAAGQQVQPGAAP